MRLGHHSIRFIAVALAVAALPAGAWGFSAQGHRWPNPATQPVPFSALPAGSDDVADGSDLSAVRQAFQTWQDVTCSYLAFAEAPWTGERVVQNDGINRIFWVEDGQEWPGQPATLALTYTFYSVDGDRRITDADMIINGADWRWTTVEAEIGQGEPAAVDIETVVFHEVGHFFGLDHSQDPEAAMFPSNNKPVQRGPATDDIRGICALYPNGEAVPGAPAGGAPVGSPCVMGTDCASRLCIEDVQIQRTYCTRICVASQPDACPAGFTCESAGDGNSYCLAPTPVDELCDQCSSGEQCASGLCVTVPDVNNLQPFCSRACDPTPGQPQNCPSGFQCVVTRQAATLVGSCVPNTGICDPQGKGGQNELCYANGTCKPGHRCVEYYPNSGLFFCYAECPASFAGQSCGLPRTVCAPVAGLMDSASCFTFATVGQPCIPEVCDDRSFCAWDETVGIDSAICYQRCPNGAGDCPANTQCLVFDGLPPLCVPNDGFKLDGEVCLSDAECESRTCRPFGNASLCTRGCEASDPNGCTPGLRCYVAAGQTTGFCGPQQIANPVEEDRQINDQTTDFCACDRTNQCDDDCDCDPECGDSSCSCRSTAVSGGSASTASPVIALLAAALLIVVRRRRT